MAHGTLGNTLESPGFREVRLSQRMWHMERLVMPWSHRGSGRLGESKDVAHGTFGNTLESPGFREVRLSQRMWRMKRLVMPWSHRGSGRLG